MKAALFKGAKNLETVELEIPSLRANELLVKINSCGVCGTDFHIFNGLAPAANNTVLGHEFSGEIVETGESCDGFKVGDKIAVDPNIYCGECSYCKSGQVHFCKNHKAHGVTINGGFAEYAVVPLSQAYRIPNQFPLEFAAFAEPLSCCIHGVDKAEIKAGETVAIVGGGAIGLLMLQLVKLSGASKILLVEPDDFRRSLALKLGADHVLDPKSETIFKEVEMITGGGADTVIECVGKSSAVEMSIGFAGRGGKIVIFGLAPVNSKIQINLQEFFHKELSLRNSFLNPFTFGRSVEMLVAQRVKVDELPVTSVGLENLKDVLNRKIVPDTLKYQFQNK